MNQPGLVPCPHPNCPDRNPPTKAEHQRRGMDRPVGPRNGVNGDDVLAPRPPFKGPAIPPITRLPPRVHDSPHASITVVTVVRDGDLIGDATQLVCSEVSPVSSVDAVPPLRDAGEPPGRADRLCAARGVGSCRHNFAEELVGEELVAALAPRPRRDATEQRKRSRPWPRSKKVKVATHHSSSGNEVVHGVVEKESRSLLSRVSHLLLLVLVTRQCVALSQAVAYLK